MSTWSQFSSTYSLVYAGNNSFQLIAKIDLAQASDSMGAMHSIDMYFSATADVAPSGKVSTSDIDLHIDLTAQNDPKAAGSIATMLSAIEGGPLCDSFARGMQAFAANSKSGTAQLQVTISASAYALINCDQYNGDKPAGLSNYNDSVNWNAFAQAADDLSAWPLRNMSTVSSPNLIFLKTFQAWEDLNEADTMATLPSRMHTGNESIWPSAFPQVDAGSQALIIHSMLAGQSFMNFCAGLYELVQASTVNSADQTWGDVVNLMTNAIKRDLQVDFLRPAALATIRLCAPSSIAVSGPSLTATPRTTFAVSLVF
jgi:hypothetical protein